MGIDLTPKWLEHLLDPTNPFIPWVVITLLTLLALHLACVYWVYRDALLRYNRGAPWALATALIPLGGWLFYLLYRTSPLVEFDRIEAELFDESDHQWTEYDQFKAEKDKGLFKELGAVVRREGGGYGQAAEASRQAEKRRKLSSEEKAEVAQLRRQRKLDARKSRALKTAEARQAKRDGQQARRERETVTGLHGATVRISERKQRVIKKQLELVEQLKALPRVDQALEDLIYEMKYAEALELAKSNLEMAREMGDVSAQATAEHYVSRLMRIIEDE